MLGNSSVAAQLAASQEGLSSIELVHKLRNKFIKYRVSAAVVIEFVYLVFESIIVPVHKKGDKTD
jgi:hypothetical protein